MLHWRHAPSLFQMQSVEWVDRRVRVIALSSALGSTRVCVSHFLNVWQWIATIICKYHRYGGNLFRSMHRVEKKVCGIIFWNLLHWCYKPCTPVKIIGIAFGNASNSFGTLSINLGTVCFEELRPYRKRLRKRDKKFEFLLSSFQHTLKAATVPRMN